MEHAADNTAIRDLLTAYSR